MFIFSFLNPILEICLKKKSFHWNIVENFHNAASFLFYLVQFSLAARGVILLKSLM